MPGSSLRPTTSFGTVEGTDGRESLQVHAELDENLPEHACLDVSCGGGRRPTAIVWATPLNMARQRCEALEIQEQDCADENTFGSVVHRFHLPSTEKARNTLPGIPPNWL